MRRSTNPDRAPALELEAVTKSYGARTALRGVDLTVEPGEVVGLLGPNGAGKTTLLSIVAGLLRCDGGTARVCGWDVARDRARAQHALGFAPQVTGLYDSLSVAQNLDFFGRLAGLRRRQLAERIDAVCDALLLAGLRHRPCRDLSGGERRRVHTAVALVAQPALLLLDEPTVGADIETRAALIEVVRELAVAGTAILYTTHYLPEIESLDAEVVLLDAGRVIARGPIETLVAEHGCGVLELRFTGEAPSVVVDDLTIVREGDRLLVSTSTPASAAARILNRLGGDLQRLESVNVLRPSLESVFVGLTGSALDAEEATPHAA